MSNEFQFDADELAELQGMFFEQATEVLDSLGELIIQVERDPSDTEVLRSIRRAVHTLKGDSMAFDFKELTELAHHFEDALDRVRARDGSASRTLIDLLLAGSDALAALVKHYRGDGPAPETKHLVAELAALHEAEEEPLAVVAVISDDRDVATQANIDALVTETSLLELPVLSNEVNEPPSLLELESASGEFSAAEVTGTQVSDEEISETTATPEMPAIPPMAIPPMSVTSDNPRDELAASTTPPRPRARNAGRVKIGARTMTAAHPRR